MSKPVIKIDIVSDVVCPWCYVGKRRLEKAINATSSEFEFVIDFIPFELNQGSENSEMPLREYLGQKYGYTPEQVDEMADRVAAVADLEGIEMNFENINFTANTLLAHQLIESAKDLTEKGKIKEALLKAYFTDNVHVGLKENLIKVAQKAGLKQEYIEKFTQLTSTKEVEEKQLKYKQMGINAVPSFIINNHYLIKGAQETETFIKTFRDISNQ